MLSWFKAKPLGDQGEGHAARFLRANGYQILQRNAEFGRYEIDIIVRKEDTIAFVEVKTRSREDDFTPESAVNYKKRQHILRAAKQYIAEHDDGETYYRYDIVAVLLPPKGEPAITHFEDAFQP